MIKACSWCGRRTTSIVGPPHMTRVRVDWPVLPPAGDDWTICAICHVEFVRFIAGRDAHGKLTELVAIDDQR